MIRQSCLRVYMFDAAKGYMPADLRTLIRHLRLGRVEDVLEVVQDYYPRNQIPPKTQFFLEELFENEST